jgi:hypothetical protein
VTAPAPLPATTHVTAQPARASVSGGNAVVTARGASLANRQRAAVVAARLNRAGV